MIHDAGLPNVFARHRCQRRARAAVTAWGLEIVCQDEREYSSSAHRRSSCRTGMMRIALRTLILDTFRHVARNRAGAASQAKRSASDTLDRFQRPDARQERSAAWRWACGSPACDDRARRRAPRSSCSRRLPSPRDGRRPRRPAGARAHPRDGRLLLRAAARADMGADVIKVEPPAAATGARSSRARSALTAVNHGKRGSRSTRHRRGPRCGTSPPARPSSKLSARRLGAARHRRATRCARATNASSRVDQRLRASRPRGRRPGYDLIAQGAHGNHDRDRGAGRPPGERVAVGDICAGCLARESAPR